jgi:hypothetical protein
VWQIELEETNCTYQLLAKEPWLTIYSPQGSYLEFVERMSECDVDMKGEVVEPKEVGGVTGFRPIRSQVTQPVELCCISRWYTKLGIYAARPADGEQDVKPSVELVSV